MQEGCSARDETSPSSEEQTIYRDKLVLARPVLDSKPACFLRLTFCGSERGFSRISRLQYAREIYIFQEVRLGTIRWS